jgi:hypothetical protein
LPTSEFSQGKTNGIGAVPSAPEKEAFAMELEATTRAFDLNVSIRTRLILRRSLTSLTREADAGDEMIARPDPANRAFVVGARAAYRIRNAEVD